MDKIFFIHIGNHKTGTTAIQRFLNSYAKGKKNYPYKNTTFGKVFKMEFSNFHPSGVTSKTLLYTFLDPAVHLNPHFWTFQDN